VAVTGEKGVLHSLANLIGLGLPCSQTDGGDLGAGVKGVSLPIERERLERWSGENEGKYWDILSVLVRHFDIFCEME
jgi:hypothetical protein